MAFFKILLKFGVKSPKKGCFRGKSGFFYKFKY